MKEPLRAAASAIYPGDIVWDVRKDHYNIVAHKLARQFGRERIVGQDGRSIPLAYAVADKDRREAQQQAVERAELARLKAKYECGYVEGNPDGA